jgi:hypothetical protein
MATHFGMVIPGSTLPIPFETFAGSSGAPITLTGLAVGDILVYKDGSVTQRASTSGYTLLDTDGIDFDGITGIHGFSIDLADNTTADFFQAGSRYWVVVSPVTVDSQTMSFIAATFSIGYPLAIKNTFIATLSSQTSFTLNAGPAEDDALNGYEVVIHDCASAVQQSRAAILDYTGSTKTVTLAAAPTFTIAAKDNISILGPSPLMPTVTGRTLDVASTGEAGLDFTVLKSARDNTAQAGAAGTLTLDASASAVDDFYKGALIVLTGGTGAGQSRLCSGYTGSSKVAAVIPNWTTTPDNTSTFSVLPQGTGNLTHVNGSVISPSSTLDANLVSISGDTTAADNLEAALDGTGGVALTANVTGNVSGNVGGSVGSVATGGIAAASFAASAIDAAALAADAVAEIQSGLATAAALTVVDDFLDTEIAALTTAVNTIDDFLDTEIAAIKAKTDNLPTDPADASDVAASFATVNATLATLATALDTVDNFLDTEVAAIKAKTDNLPTDPADASDIAALFASLTTAVDTIDNFLDTEVAAIKAKTDLIPASPAATGDVPSAATIADTVLGRSVSFAESGAAEHSLCTIVLAGLESTVSGTTWTIRRTDGSTTHATKTVTTSASANPVVGVS